MKNEVERFKETISLVRSQGAQMKVLLLPQGTWMDQLPFKGRYEELIRALCQLTSTELIDLSRAIPDEKFVDSNHLTVEGQGGFRERIMGEILRHLREAGVNPSSQLLN